MKEKNEKNKDTSKDKENDKDEKDFDINQFFVSDAFLQFSDVVSNNIQNIIESNRPP